MPLYVHNTTFYLNSIFHLICVIVIQFIWKRERESAREKQRTDQIFLWNETISFFDKPLQNKMSESN